MGELGSEPSMEDILSSIKRIIAEEGEPGASRTRRADRVADDVSAEDVISPDVGEAMPRALDEVHRAEPRPATFASVDPATPSIDPAILSPQVAQATRGRIEALSRMIVRPEVAGSDTLEGLVRDMLKPMLSQWLDTNLPRIVEGIVEREIERISGRRDG